MKYLIAAFIGAILVLLITDVRLCKVVVFNEGYSGQCACELNSFTSDIYICKVRIEKEIQNK